MPSNRLRVLYDDNGIKVKVWDADGSKFDVSDIFQQIGGHVAVGGVWTELRLRHGTDSLETAVKFQAARKNLVFDVDAAVIRQILEMGAQPDGTPDDE